MSENSFNEKDCFFMRMALKLADEAKGQTFPNPAVGAVIVKNGKTAAWGATQKYGGMHAEALALLKAKDAARNSTLYVTLEPCCHYGRTPPCTKNIIESGVRRVVVACRDPNPLVNGKGIRLLKKNGIVVDEGLMNQEASRLNEDFFWSIKHKKPWLTLKLAMTLDGRIADTSGASKWITNSSARTYVHELRRKHAAVAVGAGTLLTDDPRLSVRHVKGISPVRFVFTSKPVSGSNLHFVKEAGKIRSVAVMPGGKRGEKRKMPDNTEVWFTGKVQPKAQFDVFCSMAYQENLTSILVEGGAKLASSMLEAGIINRLYLFYGSMLLGNGLPGISFQRETSLRLAVSLANIELMNFNQTFAVTGTLNRRT